MQVMTTDAAGQPKQQKMDGIELLMYAVKDPTGTATSRACACALLGQMALLTETEVVEQEVLSTKSKMSPEQLAELYKDDEADFDASEFQPRTTQSTRVVPVRDIIFRAGAVEDMLEAMFEITDSMLRLSPPDMPSAAPRGGRVRGTQTKPEVRSAGGACALQSLPVLAGNCICYTMCPIASKVNIGSPCTWRCPCALPAPCSDQGSRHCGCALQMSWKAS